MRVKVGWAVIALFVMLVWAIAWLNLRVLIEDNIIDIRHMRDDVRSIERKMERLETGVYDLRTDVNKIYAPPPER